MLRRHTDTTLFSVLSVRVCVCVWLRAEVWTTTGLCWCRDKGLNEGASLTLSPSLRG
jgi:hypothetical protein